MDTHSRSCSTSSSRCPVPSPSRSWPSSPPASADSCSPCLPRHEAVGSPRGAHTLVVFLGRLVAARLSDAVGSLGGSLARCQPVKRPVRSPRECHGAVAADLASAICSTALEGRVGLPLSEAIVAAASHPRGRELLSNRRRRLPHQQAEAWRRSRSMEGALGRHFEARADAALPREEEPVDRFGMRHLDLSIDRGLCPRSAHRSRSKAARVASPARA